MAQNALKLVGRAEFRKKNGVDQLFRKVVQVRAVRLVLPSRDEVQIGFSAGRFDVRHDKTVQFTVNNFPFYVKIR